ncbi:hypothetical protein BLNAU_21302 [Blattamonas nauphoetae]|uniref:Uncharacterized protein n=1 Tax=Blattamonas nauphoetae TaxID=2049346 RepID=A0ABQ9WXA2_9EUKA|nr:hypothetical protein BLNAU_21302 [Blattamonas nauphoetae]
MVRAVIMSSLYKNQMTQLMNHESHIWNTSRTFQHHLATLLSDLINYFGITVELTSLLLFATNSAQDSHINDSSVLLSHLFYLPYSHKIRLNFGFQIQAASCRDSRQQAQLR